MAEPATATSASLDPAPLELPRVVIRFCTQCKWMLRAAYYAQELLSTFSTSLGEVALQPATGGTFVVEIYHAIPSSPATSTSAATLVEQRTLWDRKTDGGFPETKELKRRVRDVIEPSRDLGHVDRDHKEEDTQKPDAATSSSSSTAMADESKKPQAGGGAAHRGVDPEHSIHPPPSETGDRPRRFWSKPRMPARHPPASGGAGSVGGPAAEASKSEVKVMLDEAAEAKAKRPTTSEGGTCEDGKCEDCQ